MNIEELEELALNENVEHVKNENEENENEIIDSKKEFEKNSENNSEEEFEEDKVRESFDYTEVLTKFGYDPNAFTIELEEGEETKPFNEYDEQTKVNVLASLLEESHQANQELIQNLELSNEEISFINEVRQSNLTPQQYISQSSQETNSDYSTWSTDQLFAAEYMRSMSDDEEFKNLSDEEKQSKIDEELEIAKNLPSFSKRMENVRKTLIKSEEDQQKILEQEELKEREQEIQQFVEDTKDLDSIGPVKLDVDTKNLLVNNIYTADENGQTQLDKDLEDNSFALKMAYYAYFGDSLVDELVNQIDQAYNNGLNEGKKEASGKYPSSRVSKKTDQEVDIDPVTGEKNISTIEELWKNFG